MKIYSFSPKIEPALQTPASIDTNKAVPDEIIDVPVSAMDISADYNRVLLDIKKPRYEIPEFGAKGFEFEEGKRYAVPMRSKLLLGGKEIKLTDYRNLISMMKDGESFSIGSSDKADITIEDDNQGIFPHHILLSRIGKKLVLTNLAESKDTKFGGVDLDAYKPSPNADLSYSHLLWCNKIGMKTRDRYDNFPICHGSWKAFNSLTGDHNAWKLHVYSDDEKDWRKMFTLLAPYLNDTNTTWKTVSNVVSVEDLNDGCQKGKAFTIYPKSDEDMAQIAKDIDYIIRKNGLTKEGSEIAGDRQMGSTGRLFYRYEYNTKDAMHEIIDTLSPEGSKRYDDLYRPSKNQGYLAPDMTVEDDIWLDFDPADKNSMPKGVN